MKGLPSLVFQGITLLIFFLYKKQFKLLFSWKSFMGGGIFLLITGMYFIIYSGYNSIHNYFEALWSESAGRTVIYHSFKENFVHLFTFPVEFIIHFLPWTLLLIFLFGKGRLKEIISNPAIHFFILIFISNLTVYWISPVIYPRYLFMFLPLLFGVGSYAYYSCGLNSRADRIIFQPLLSAFILLLPAVLLFLPFMSRSQYHTDKLVPWILFIAASLLFVWFLIRYKSQGVLIFICVWLLSRVAFNVFVLPDRLRVGRDNQYKQGALEAGRLTKDRPLFIFKDCPISHLSSYYITAERQRILSRWQNKPEQGVYYIVPLKDISSYKESQLVHVFETDIKGLQLGIIKFNSTSEK
jgi:hypothetical protein